MVKVTRTTNPLPFEHLEPHRFEDLVRQLMYDFRDWHSIEATGRSGSDEGFDIRAWERNKDVVNTSDTDENEDIEEGRHILEGNLWMVQCKREQSIGPTKVKDIITSGVNKDNPPYGYILAASATFSKKSYDVFREELLKKGVSEFYIWGREQLEDMLYMPKNDRVLFTFFGLSFSSKKRSRSSEIRFVVNNKNKLIKALAGGNQEQSFRESVLVRDYNDIYYPYKKEYKDFETNPRWQEHIATSIHPEGLVVLYREHYCFVDKEKKEFDFSPLTDLTRRREDAQLAEDKRKKKAESREHADDYWVHMPKKNQAKFIVKGLIPFENILVIDKEGDPWHPFPHIFVDFKGKENPFVGHFTHIEQGNYHENIYPGSEGYKRVQIFPDKFSKAKKGKIYRDRQVDWPADVQSSFKDSEHITCLYDVDAKYSFLKPRDIILVIKGENNSDNYYIEITHSFEINFKRYLDEHVGSFARKNIESQVGREIKDDETLVVYEFLKRYGFQIDR